MAAKREHSAGPSRPNPRRRRIQPSAQEEYERKQDQLYYEWCNKRIADIEHNRPYDQEDRKAEYDIARNIRMDRHGVHRGYGFVTDSARDAELDAIQARLIKSQATKRRFEERLTEAQAEWDLLYAARRERLRAEDEAERDRVAQSGAHKARERAVDDMLGLGDVLNNLAIDDGAEDDIDLHDDDVHKEILQRQRSIDRETLRLRGEQSAWKSDTLSIGTGLGQEHLKANNPEDDEHEPAFDLAKAALKRAQEVERNARKKQRRAFRKAQDGNAATNDNDDHLDEAGGTTKEDKGKGKDLEMLDVEHDIYSGHWRRRHQMQKGKAKEHGGGGRDDDDFSAASYSDTHLSSGLIKGNGKGKRKAEPEAKAKKDKGKGKGKERPHDWKR